MEHITLEQIDLLMQRANVSYSEAKEALEACNGDTLEALLKLEKAEKIKKSSTLATSEGVKSFIHKLNATSFILHKKEHTYVNVPLSVALIAMITCFHVSLLALVIAIATGCRIDLKGENELAKKLNDGIVNLQK